MTTSTDLARRALAEIGTRTTITSLDDGSNEANYAKLLYAPLRDLLLREGDYDWSMKEAAAIATAAPQFPWSYAYTYPADAIRIRSAIPLEQNFFEPLPLEWNVSIAGSGRTVVSKNQISLFVYTFAPVEDFWDAIFQESFVRLLGSALAFALENRIEASKVKLEEALNFAGLADLRQP